MTTFVNSFCCTLCAFFRVDYLPRHLLSRIPPFPDRPIPEGIGEYSPSQSTCPKRRVVANLASEERKNARGTVGKGIERQLKE